MIAGIAPIIKIIFIKPNIKKEGDTFILIQPH